MNPRYMIALVVVVCGIELYGLEHDTHAVEVRRKNDNAALISTPFAVVQGGMLHEAMVVTNFNAWKASYLHKTLRDSSQSHVSLSRAIFSILPVSTGSILLVAIRFGMFSPGFNPAGYAVLLGGVIPVVDFVYLWKNEKRKRRDIEMNLSKWDITKIVLGQCSYTADRELLAQNGISSDSQAENDKARVLISKEITYVSDKDITCYLKNQLLAADGSYKQDAPVRVGKNGVARLIVLPTRQ